MTDYFSKYLSEDSSFHIEEKEIERKRLGHRETIFALGNGFLGSRGVLEEMPSGSIPGTFIAGLFDKSAAQVEELVNLPNPINFMIAVDGEKFDLFTMKVVEHKRILDMRNACLIRRTVYKDAKKRKYLYQSIRFFSMDDPHICSMKVSLKLIKGHAQLAIVGRIDDSVFNSGGMMLPRKRHFNTIKADKEEAFDYLLFRTNHYKHLISYGDALLVKKGKKENPLLDRFYQFDLNSDEEVTFTKFFTIFTSYNYSEKSLKRETMRLLNDTVDKGFETLYKAHLKSMNQRWKKSDIIIEGDSEVQKAMRFNIYHIMIAARKEYAKYNIGAKTLSGEGYRGHIFWDTEIYMLPFFLYTDPEIARELVMFRYNTLPQAKEIAREKGYKGAMYPWESTPTGYEQTPRYSKTSAGQIVEVHTQDYEHHITADVAFGVYNYFSITDDREFMCKYGLEIILETARFWASRVEYSKKDDSYHINSVIGPDEFHVNVDDNAYTNYLAKWNLLCAADMFYRFEKACTETIKKVGVNKKEISEWKSIADKINILYSKKKAIISQFDGYLSKKDHPLKVFNNLFLPEIPKLYLEDLNKTTFLKQPDVLALFCLFPNNFTHDEKESNYKFYIQRTAHKSSLSYCMHAILANELGDYFRSFCFFWAAINIDLYDVPGNTIDGIHAANLGGVWQALMFGYAGIKCDQDNFNIVPHLPGNINSLKFRMFYKGTQYEIEETRKYINIRYLSKSSKKDDKRIVKIYGKEVELKPNTAKHIDLEKFYINVVTVEDVIKEKNLHLISQNMSVRDAKAMLVEKKLTGASVVDDKGNLKGMLSEKNILQSTYKNRFGNLKVADIMETEVVSVKVNDSLEKLAKTFAKNNFLRLPVLKNRKVVGVIYRKDLIKEYIEF